MVKAHIKSTSRWNEELLSYYITEEYRKLVIIAWFAWFAWFEYFNLRSSGKK